MFLLDTNVISELRQGKPMQNAQVLAWAQQQIHDYQVAQKHQVELQQVVLMLMM